MHVMSKCALSWNIAKCISSGGPLCWLSIAGGSISDAMLFITRLNAKLPNDRDLLVMDWLCSTNLDADAVRNVNSYNAFSCEIKCRAISYYEMPAT